MLPLRMKATTPSRKSKKPLAPASTTPARARTASFLGVSLSDLSATGSEYDSSSTKSVILRRCS